MIANPEKALDALTREELGLNPDDSRLADRRGNLVVLHLLRRREPAADPLSFSAIAKHGILIAAADFGRRAVLRRRGLEPVLGPQRPLWRRAHAVDRHRAAATYGILLALWR